MHGNQSDAQFIAARERAKQMQMRQMSLSAQANMTGDGMRQLSPGSQQGMPNSAGPSGMPNNPQAQMAALNQMGPMGVQVMQALQNPAHQITQYLIQNIPNFHTLPLNAQVGQFMRVQVRVSPLSKTYVVLSISLSRQLCKTVGRLLKPHSPGPAPWVACSKELDRRG